MPAATAAKVSTSANNNRMLSIVGAVSLGSDLAKDGWANFLMFMVEMNIVLGIINFIPLLPFDGGHVAVATYEKIRELIRGTHARYYADANKLLPVVYGVVFVLLAVGLMAMYLDIADPLTVR